MTLSISIIVFNGEPLIRRCLESVQWADEIIVLDNGSTDKTLEICSQLGIKVHQTMDFPGYGIQKNRALDLTTGDWVLALDHDEWVSPPLRAEIEALIQSAQPHNGYDLPRLSQYCGRTMRHGGWWPDPVLRLFRRGEARFSEDPVHEKLILKGPKGRIRNPLHHDPMTNLEQVLRKVNAYSTAGARSSFAQGKRSSLKKALFHGLWAFLRTDVLKAGFLDGREGFMLAISNAEGTYYRYLKLMLLESQQD